MKKLLIMILAIALLTGCSSTPSNNSANNTTKAPAAEKLSIIGSTSVHPLMEKLVAEYKKTNNITVDLQGVGSSAGLKQANEGTADIGMSSRDLKPEEKAWGLEETVIARDGIAVIVNPANPVANLTKDQVTKIFKGEIKNWSEVGGPDKAIVVISREAGSGTRGAFEELLKLQADKDGKTISMVRQDALINDSNGSVKAGVSGKDAAIGYLSMGAVDSSIKALDIEGVKASEDNVKNNTYSISRGFIIVTKGAPSDTEKKFIDFILSDAGQKIVADGYISIK